VPDLLAMSFEGELAPSFTLHCLAPGRRLPDGQPFARTWGRRTITQTDHIRTAVGRNRLDATPTSGTIFVVGGGGETLAVEVTVEPHEQR
jgi:hypothetical protein